MATLAGKRPGNNPVSGQRRWRGGWQLRGVAECRRPEFRSWPEGLGRGPRAPESSNVCSAPCAQIAGKIGPENWRPSIPEREGDDECL
ncbi:hypothetical protein D3C72_2320340 [compost metagenome]